MRKQKTPIARLITAKWFLPMSRLSEQSGIPKRVLALAISGKEISEENKSKIITFLRTL